MPRKCEGAGIIFKTSLTSCFLQESSKQKLPVAILFPGVALLVISRLCIPPQVHKSTKSIRLYRLMNGHSINELSYIFTSLYINLEIYLFTCPSMHLPICLPSPHPYPHPHIYLRLPGQGSQYVKMLAEAGDDCHDDWHITHHLRLWRLLSTHFLQPILSVGFSDLAICIWHSARSGASYGRQKQMT